MLCCAAHTHQEVYVEIVLTANTLRADRNNFQFDPPFPVQLCVRTVDYSTALIYPFKLINIV